MGTHRQDLDHGKGILISIAPGRLFRGSPRETVLAQGNSSWPELFLWSRLEFFITAYGHAKTSCCYSESVFG
jgi:hypothetical protein